MITAHEWMEIERVIEGSMLYLVHGKTEQEVKLLGIDKKIDDRWKLIHKCQEMWTKAIRHENLIELRRHQRRWLKQNPDSESWEFWSLCEEYIEEIEDKASPTPGGHGQEEIK